MKTYSLNSPETKEIIDAKGLQFTKSPEDWRDIWIYFLLVDRFNNPEKSPSPDEFPCNVYQSGTFEGIVQQLPYLKKLGVGAIWLSPVLMNSQWFTDYWGGYGIQNYMRIEPRFCKNPTEALNNPEIAEQEFRNLVDQAHALGIYVIMDIVLNHTGDLFNYEGMLDSAPWNPNSEYKIFWRDENGVAKGDWSDIAAISDLPVDAGIFPIEFHRNDYFRRRGDGEDGKASGNIAIGDFGSLKEW